MGHAKRVKVGTFSLLRHFPPGVLCFFFLMLGALVSQGCFTLLYLWSVAMNKKGEVQTESNHSFDLSPRSSCVQGWGGFCSWSR